MVYWKEEEALLISDVHLGKTHHFRKAGIAVPNQVKYQNLDLLESLFESFIPKKVLFLGDLFHSRMTKDEVSAFVPFFTKFTEIQFQLILGNHDILPATYYNDLNLELFDELKIGPFLLTHEPFEGKTDLYNLCGHIHPAIRLRGKGRQSIRLACFFFGKTQGILPAFGHFTGTFTLRPKKSDQVFGIVEDEVIRVS